MASRSQSLRIKRVYEPASTEDGRRVLVDRAWSRGLTKERAAVATWLKEIAPSAELRKWFGHDPARWEEFQRRYRSELAQNDETVGRLIELVAAGPVTLLFGARDEAHNQAVVLAEYIAERGKQRG